MMEENKLIIITDEIMNSMSKEEKIESMKTFRRFLEESPNYKEERKLYEGLIRSSSRKEIFIHLQSLKNRYKDLVFYSQNLYSLMIGYKFKDQKYLKKFMILLLSN